MKTHVLKISLLIVVLACSNSIFAANYYFSTSSGNDSRSSTEAQNPNTPWKSIEKLNAVFNTLKPGDAVYFKRGDVFYGSIHVTRSGTPGRPITVGAYGSGTKPVISSLVSLNNWKRSGSGVFESSSPLLKNEQVNIVLMDNVSQEMGRFPNSSTANRGYLNIDRSSSSSVVSNSLSSSINWKGAEVVIRKNFWIIDRHPIKSHSGANLTFAPVAGTSYSPTNDYGFFIQNHPETLDHLGEWYYNPNSKKLSFFFGSKAPSSVEVSVGTLDYLVTNSGWNIKHVTFDNLHFRGANKYAFNLKGGNDVHITNCDIEFSGEDAVVVEGTSNLLFENNKILNANNNGMTLKSTANAIIRNNQIQDVLIFPGMGRNGDGNGFGIYSPNENNLIEYNRIANIGYVGVRFGGNNSVVKNNLIENFSLTKNDGGGIYVYTGNSNTIFKNRKITGNIILNGMGAKEGTSIRSEMFKPQSEGIYLDDNTTGVEVSQNTIANITSKGIYLHNAQDNKVHNNLVFNTKYQLTLVSDHLGGDIRNNEIRDNMFVAKTGEQYNLNISTLKDDIKQMGRFNNNIYANPLTDGYRILTTVLRRTNQESSATFDLHGWKNKYGMDVGSKTNTHNVPTYKQAKLIGENKYANGSFDKSTHVSVNGASSTWKANSKLDGGAIEIKGKGTFDMIFNVGKVSKDKTYLLKFSAIGAKELPIKAYLRYSKSPWLAVTPETSFDIKTNRGEYETLFKPNTSLDVAYLMLKVENAKDAEFTIDNVSLHEAEVELVDPDESILFEVNPSKTEKTIHLNGHYVDVHNKSYSGSVKIKPYGSIILLKIDDLPEEETPPVVQLASPVNNRSYDFASKIDIDANVKHKSGKVSKVEFFNGETLLKTMTTPPYTFILSNLETGSHAITAMVTDERGRTGVSEAAYITINKPPAKSPPPSLPGNSEKDGGGFSPILLNTGSSEDVYYQDMMFVGDKSLPLYYNNTSTYSNTSASKEKLMQNERNGKNVNFTIPLPNGTYTIKTYHHELWFGKKGPTAQAGRRVFDIKLEGKLVRDKFDIFVYNQNKPTVLVFENIQIKDGLLNLELVAVVNNATISGLSIEKPGAVLPNYYSLYLNTGSGTTVTDNEKSFIGDQKNSSYYNSNSTYSNRDASDRAIFQTERNGRSLHYTIPLADGIYTIKTYHNELWFGKKGPSQQAGRRVFDISLEGNIVKKNFDIFRESRNQPIVLTFEDIEVKDGKLNLDMEASVNNASISGISIEGYATLSLPNFRTETIEMQTTEERSDFQVEVKKTQLYPNPARETTTLEIATEVHTILIHNMNGQLVKTLDPGVLQLGRGKYAIPLTNISNGLYLISLVNNSGAIERHQLVVN